MAQMVHPHHVRASHLCAHMRPGVLCLHTHTRAHRTNAPTHSGCEPAPSSHPSPHPQRVLPPLPPELCIINAVAAISTGVGHPSSRRLYPPPHIRVVLYTLRCCYFQESVTGVSAQYLAEARRYNYVTPTTYLELLGAFRSLLQVFRIEMAP